MKITSNSRYKSLDQIQNLTLPDFVVLFGVNGAGKSHLLQMLANQNITSITDNDVYLARRKLVNTNNLAPNDATVVTWDSLKQSQMEAYNLHKTYRHNKSNNPNISITQVTNDPKKLKIFAAISKSATKSLDELNSDEIIEHYPLYDYGSNEDVFSQSFSQLFKRYQIKKNDNDFNEFRHQKDKNVKFLSEAEFIQRYGEAPWDFVNKIISEANLNYHINSPVNQDRDTPFELKLINDINGAEVNFSDLSGGEKVLMSLALSLYNSNFDIDYPQILLMDEPDAPLHPSMTRQFLQVIENVFVKDKKVKVILTTHSPSTVALAPNNSLYQMSKTDPRIIKTNKDKALRILTYGVPSLSISYENRRQVFVESKNDVIFYEKVYEKLKDKLIDEISINFISSGSDGQGSSNQVKDVVNKLTNYGNRFIYGIVDWDLTNNPNDHVKVLGHQKRYSIENYILDPLILAAFLLREKMITREEIGLSINENYLDFPHLDQNQIQTIANFVINKIKAEISNEKNTLEKCSLINGKDLFIPKWYLECQGHMLEIAIKQQFKQLNQYNKSEGLLKEKIIDTIFDDIPSIISTDLIELFKSIQNYTE